MLQLGQKSKRTIKLTNLGLTTPNTGICLCLFSVTSATAAVLFILCARVDIVRTVTGV